MRHRNTQNIFANDGVNFWFPVTTLVNNVMYILLQEVKLPIITTDIKVLYQRLCNDFFSFPRYDFVI